jgi:hypothetical protein
MLSPARTDASRKDAARSVRLPRATRSGRPPARTTSPPTSPCPERSANHLAIGASGTPSAASLRISAQSSEVITLQGLSAHFSPPKVFNFRAPPTCWSRYERGAIDPRGDDSSVAASARSPAVASIKACDLRCSVDGHA